MSNLEFLRYLEKEKLIFLEEFKPLYYDLGIMVWDSNVQHQEIFLFDAEENVIE